VNPIVEARNSPTHGTGVFAVEPIEEGAFIGTYQGSPTAVDGTHVLWVDDGKGFKGVDGTGVLRYLNHSRTPNTWFDGRDLYALRDIDEGEELLFDYGEHWADVP